MDWAQLQVRVKALASNVGDAVDSAGLRIAEWGPVQQFLASRGKDPIASRAASSTIAKVGTIGVKKMASVTTVDLLALATSLPYAGQVSMFASGVENITIQQFDNSFASILGSSPSWRMIANESYQAFHEAGVYLQDTKSLYISSNWANDFSNPINVSILNLEDYSLTSERYDGLFAPNGGTTYVTPNTSTAPELLFCEEGSFDVASALTLVDPVAKTTKVRLPDCSAIPY